MGGPVEIRTLDLPSGEDRVLLRGEALPYYPPRPESIRIPGTEGDIPCYVYRPDRVAGRVPALLFIHGGPEGQSRPQFMGGSPPAGPGLGARVAGKGGRVVLAELPRLTG